MTISDLEFYLVDIQRAGARAAVRSMLVRLATDSGLEGWGESRVSWRDGELSARRDALLPVLAGRSVFDIEELLTLKVLQDPPLRCALEMASWDLVGRVAGQPLCHLFGGGYRQRIPLAVRLTGSSDSQLAQAGRELAVQGFHWQIVASVGRFETDLAIVRAVRESVGAHVQLRLDVAGNYDPLTAGTVPGVGGCPGAILHRPHSRCGLAAGRRAGPADQRAAGRVARRPQLQRRAGGRPLGKHSLRGRGPGAGGRAGAGAELRGGCAGRRFERGVGQRAVVGGGRGGHAAPGRVDARLFKLQRMHLLSTPRRRARRAAGDQPRHDGRAAGSRVGHRSRPRKSKSTRWPSG